MHGTGVLRNAPLPYGVASAASASSSTQPPTEDQSPAIAWSSFAYSLGDVEFLPGTSIIVSPRWTLRRAKRVSWPAKADGRSLLPASGTGVYQFQQGASRPL